MSFFHLFSVYFSKELNPLTGPSAGTGLAVVLNERYKEKWLKRIWSIFRHIKRAMLSFTKVDRYQFPSLYLVVVV